MRVSFTYANATSTIADQNQAQARGTDPGVAKIARTGASKNHRHRVSHAKMRRQKGPGTAIYTGCTHGHRTKRHSHSQRHRHMVIGTETGNGMAHGR